MFQRLIRIFLFIAIPLLLLSISSTWIFEWMWLNQLGYSEIFWTLRGTQVILTIGAFLIAATYFTINFRYLANQLQYVSLSGTPLQNVNFDFSSDFANKRIRQFFTLGALFIALLFAFSFYIRWDESLRFFWEMPFGETDPIFGRDIGYYLFQFPFWELLQSSLISIVFLTAAILVVIYLFSGLLTVKSPTDFSARPAVMKHLSLNVGIWLLLLSWGFFLARYRLLFKADGIVFGAGYTDIMIQLPAIWVLFGLSFILGVLILINRWVKLGKIVPAAAVLTLVVFILGRVLLPGIIQQFNVEPNELELERPYLANNIEMTRLAYNLHNVSNIEYLADDTLGIDDI